MNLAELQALDLISKLPDDVPLTVEEAAIFLRMSPSTLNKMRMPNHPTGGPVYSQGGKKGAGGANQKVLYMKGDLVAWVRENRVSDTLAAAVRKGQMFATLADVAEERPFWLDEEGRIAGSVWETSVDVFFARLLSPLWNIRWMSALDAAVVPWSRFMAKRALAGAVERALTDALGAVRASAERDEFDAVAADGDERDRRF